MKLVETWKGKVRLIFDNGKRVQIARNHGVYEINNAIPDLKLGDFVICNDYTTIQKIDSSQTLLNNPKFKEKKMNTPLM